MPTYETKPFETVTQDTQFLKRSYASLSGWIKRKDIRILDNAQPSAFLVVYQGRFMRTKAWFTSPGGKADTDLVRRYMETKATLEKLNEL